MDRLTELTVFRLVADTGSFIAAARKLGLSAPAVSKSIAALETRLGVRLIQRTTRRMSLTEAGVTYLEDVRQILDKLDEADRAMGPMQDQPSGLLRVTAPMTVALAALSQAMPEFLRRFPAVQLDLHLDDHRVDLVREGFDLAIRVRDATDDSRLIARQIYSLDLVLVASPAYWAARGVPASPAALSGHECIRFPLSAHTDRWTFRKGVSVESVKVVGRYSVGSGIAIRDALVAGFGLSLTPRLYVADDLASGRLEAVLSDWKADATPIYAVYPSRRHLPPKVRAFIDFVAAQFAAVE